MADDTQFQLLNQLTDLDDAIRDHTKELVWFSGVALAGGLLRLSLPLFVGGAAGLASAWAIRHRKLVTVGVASTVTTVALAVHATTRIVGPWTAWHWLDIALCVTLVVDLFIATIALARYRRADAEFQQRARANQERT